MKKLYCYIDETGQDTKGKLFLVSVVITENEQDKIKSILESIEKKSNKKSAKWHKTKSKIRQKYLEEIFSRKIFQNKIFFSQYQNTKEYVDLTILTTAKAILKKAKSNYKATILVDGLKKSEVKKFSAGLRKLQIQSKKVRGIREQSDSLMRLADAIAGFLRDYLEKQKYTKKLYEKAKHNKIIYEI